MYIHALRILDSTDVMALYSSNVSFVYLLSWVVLHEQFVGVRIVAVILCSTGIALLAYMDGLMKSPILGGVLLGAASSAGSAVYKVMFKKLFGDANFGEVALFFTLISTFSTLLLWPILTLLYFTGAEIVTWERIPWKELTGAAGLSLVTNLLGNFGIAITYEVFITLGLVVAVPLSAGTQILLPFDSSFFRLILFLSLSSVLPRLSSLLLSRCWAHWIPRSHGHAFLFGEICRNEALRHHPDSGRLLSGIVPGELAGLPD